VQRRANLAGTFALAGGVPAGAVLVLVDDVVSSGATLTEAAAVLGAATRPTDPPVLAAVVAATPRTRSRATSVSDPHVVRKRSQIVLLSPSGRLSGRVNRD
jgi:orotate phosphoribosyltransferase